MPFVDGGGLVENFEDDGGPGLAARLVRHNYPPVQDISHTVLAQLSQLTEQLEMGNSAAAA